MFPKLIPLAMMVVIFLLPVPQRKDMGLVTVDTSSSAGVQSKQSGLALSRETATVSVLSP